MFSQISFPVHPCSSSRLVKESNGMFWWSNPLFKQHLLCFFEMIRISIDSNPSNVKICGLVPSGKPPELPCSLVFEYSGCRNSNFFFIKSGNRFINCCSFFNYCLIFFKWWSKSVCHKTSFLKKLCNNSWTENSGDPSYSEKYPP